MDRRRGARASLRSRIASLAPSFPFERAREDECNTGVVDSALRRLRRHTAKGWRDANARKWPSIRCPVGDPIFANGMGGERRGLIAAFERAPRARSQHRRLGIVGSRESGRRSLSGAATTQRGAVTSPNTQNSLPIARSPISRSRRLTTIVTRLGKSLWRNMTNRMRDLRSEG